MKLATIIAVVGSLVFAGTAGAHAEHHGHHHASRHHHHAIHRARRADVEAETGEPEVWGEAESEPTAAEWENRLMAADYTPEEIAAMLEAPAEES